MVKALAGWETKSELVIKTFLALGRASELSGANIKIQWVKGHAGCYGNELADHNARIGRLEESYKVIDPPRVTYKHVKSIIGQGVVEAWMRRWTTETDTCRQTREWFPVVNPKLSAQLLQEKRTNLAKYILVMTGHNHWRRHNYLIAYSQYQRRKIAVDEVGNPYCDFCHDPGIRPLVPPLRPLEGVPLQTSGHIVAECTKFNTVRQKVFGIPNAMPIEQIKKKDILRFFAEADLKILPHNYEEIDLRAQQNTQ